MIKIAILRVISHFVHTFEVCNHISVFLTRVHLTKFTGETFCAYSFYKHACPFCFILQKVQRIFITWRRLTVSLTGVNETENVK